MGILKLRLLTVGGFVRRGTEVAVKRFVRDVNSMIPNGSPTKTANAAGGSEVENQIMKSFAHMASMSPEGAAAVIDKKAVTPAAMGQTMSAKQSKAMVEMVKSQASVSKLSKSSRGESGNWLRKTFASDKEYEKQRAEFVEEIKKLASLRHQ